MDVVIGVDAGNTKTDVVVADLEGHVRLWVRGGPVPVSGGPHTAVTHVSRLLGDALCGAGSAREHDVVVAGAYFLANLDTEGDEREALQAFSDAKLSGTSVVHNDAFAILEAGAGWGIGIIVGTGMNAVGISPSGRVARFLALGDISGDWGGAFFLARSAVAASVRAVDGRGAATVLQTSVPEFLGFSTPTALAIAVVRDGNTAAQLHRAAPLVFHAAKQGDAVAQSLVDRLVSEISSLARAAMDRLGLTQAHTPVVLAGGVASHQRATLVPAVSTAINDGGVRNADVTVMDAPPVLGSVLAALRLGGHCSDAARRHLQSTLCAGRPLRVPTHH